MIHGQKSVCNNMRMSKWWHKFNFLLWTSPLPATVPKSTLMYQDAWFICLYVYLVLELFLSFAPSFSEILIPQIFSVYIPSLFLMPVCWVLSVRWRMYECVRERCEAHGIVSVWACVFACICVADTHKVKVTLEVICKATQPGMLH